MCLIIFAHQVHPDYPLLVAANRDEYYDRPTEAAGFWHEVPGLLAGRDRQAGGTWLGLTRNGRFAAITNHRNPPTTPLRPRSRGLLTRDYLSGDMHASDYLQSLQQSAEHYAGFNLLLGCPDTMYYYSNINGEALKLKPGIYGLSNALLDTPWPKVLLGTDKLRALMNTSPDHKDLQALVASRKCAVDTELPETGISVEMERLLSAQFIRSGSYGTRATTSIWRHRGGTSGFAESTWLATGEPGGYREYTLADD